MADKKTVSKDGSLIENRFSSTDKEKHVHTSTVRNEGDVPGSLALGDHVFNKLLKERIIWLGSEVGEENANQICAQMMLLAAQDSEKPIFLYINSPGGSVTAGMAIYDTMQYIEPEVVTVALGMAASMGQLLLSAGAPGKRYATPHARILMHQPSGGVGGTASDIRINANLILQMKKELAEIIAQRTGKSVEQIRQDSERDHWFTAQEALEYGFIDHVITSARNLGSDGKEL